jgi:hypothetical protein
MRGQSWLQVSLATSRDMGIDADWRSYHLRKQTTHMTQQQFRKRYPFSQHAPAETSINQLFTILVVLLFTFEKRDSLGCVNFVILTRITRLFFVCSLKFIMTNHDAR